MTIVCVACQRYLGTRPPFRDLRVTHALCTSCAIRQRRELSTLVVSPERADAWPVLENVFRFQGELHVVVERRRGAERRQACSVVEVCRRSAHADRRQIRSLRLV
jgi:hypothetical protein